MDLFTQAFDHQSRLNKYSNSLDILDRVLTNPIIIFLIVATFLQAAEQYVGQPIHCLTPELLEQGPTGPYLQDLCFLNGTYTFSRYSENNKLNSYFFTDQTKPVRYYPWVGFILIFSIFFYIAPTLIWKSMQKRISISVPELIKIADQYNIGASIKDREAHVKSITSSIVSFMAQHKGFDQFTVLFFLYKFIMLTFNILAIVFLCVIFGREYLFFSFHFFQSLLNNKPESNIFPTDVVCQATYIVQASEPRNTVDFQCFLTTNIFSIFIFAILNILQWGAVITSLINICIWFYRISMTGRKRFIDEYMYGVHHKFEYTNALDLLKGDGITILILIGANSNQMAVAAVVQQLCIVDQRTRFVQPVESETEYEIEQKDEVKVLHQ